MPFKKTLWQSTCEIVLNTCDICLRALLSCFFITVIWKISPILILEILGVFVTILASMKSFLFQIVRICNSQFKCNYLKNKKYFRNFLFHFLNLRQTLNIWGKWMMVIANVFRKLQAVEILVRPLYKKRCFRTRFDSQDVRAS